jgi:hypothetical protein
MDRKCKANKEEKKGCVLNPQRSAGVRWGCSMSRPIDRDDETEYLRHWALHEKEKGKRRDWVTAPA